MKKNVVGALLVVSMLVAMPVSAEGEVVVATPAPKPAAAPAATPAPAPVEAPASESVAPASNADGGAAATPAAAAGTSFVSSFLNSAYGTARAPFDLARDKFWNPYPHVAGATAAVVGFWAMYKFCPWFREDVLGCTKKRKNEDNLF